MRISIRYFIGILLVFSPLCICAQDTDDLSNRASRWFNEGQSYFAQGNYSDAADIMERVLRRYPEFVPAHYYVGIANFELGNCGDAIQAFEFITAQDSVPPMFIDSWLLLGNCYMKQGQYERAVTPIEKFAELSEGTRWESAGQRWMANAKFAVSATANPVEFEPEMVDLPVRENQSVYLPVKSLDGERMMYTIRDQGREYLVSSTKTEDGWSLPGRLPFLEAYPQTAAPSLSPDGNLMLLTICNHRDNIGGCDLYLASRSTTTGEWRGPFNLGEQVNSRGWDSQPVFGPDGRTFYFASDRPGGHGGRDIWYSRLLSGGNFAKPVNAGPEINSPGNEASPFLHQDGRTLFFKSNGHPGMGDYDIFISRRDENGEWKSPVNLGYPINTMAHDGAIFVDSDGITAYMASDRFQPTEKRGIYRIYRFKLPEFARAIPVTYVKAKVTDAETGMPLKANARIVNLSEDEAVYDHILGDAGTMFAVLRTDASYSLNVDKQGYEFISRRIIVEGEASADDPYLIHIELQRLPHSGDTAVPAIVLENVLFEFGSHRLDASSHAELDRLVNYLESQGEVIVEIHGHTDSIGDPEVNLELSEKRAQSVVDYLVKKGVSNARISARGFGETKPIADNDSEEGRALNRRTELVIVRDDME